MRKPVATLCAAAALLSMLPGVAISQKAPAQLSPPGQRISDPVIQADFQAYETLEGRLKALNERGRPLGDYFMAKAQCWLDVSFHEYSRNDRSHFPQAAMTEAEKLIIGMETGSQNLSLETELVNNAARLREDLWTRITRLKLQEGFRCAQQKIACAEVELVHAGNEYQQQQWRHAQPYVQIAEEAVAEATDLAKQCDVPVKPAAPAACPVIPAQNQCAVAPVQPTAPPVIPVPAAAAPVVPASPPGVLSAHMLFNFDKSAYHEIRPASIAQLDQVVQKIRAEQLRVASIQLIGHADRLNSTGMNDYNLQLAQRRVETVRVALVRLGFDGRLISAEARGDSQQVNSCEAARFRSPAELQECLLPNRRVEVQIRLRP